MTHTEILEQAGITLNLSKAQIEQELDKTTEKFTPAMLEIIKKVDFRNKDSWTIIQMVKMNAVLAEFKDPATGFVVNFKAVFFEPHRRDVSHSISFAKIHTFMEKTKAKENLNKDTDFSEYSDLFFKFFTECLRITIETSDLVPSYNFSRLNITEDLTKIFK